MWTSSYIQDAAHGLAEKRHIIYNKSDKLNIFYSAMSRKEPQPLANTAVISVFRHSVVLKIEEMYKHSCMDFSASGVKRQKSFCFPIGSSKGANIITQRKFNTVWFVRKEADSDGSPFQS